MHFDNFSFCFHFRGMAFSFAVITRPLNLGNHPGSELLNVHDRSLAVTLGTFVGIAHDNFSVNRKLDGFPIIQIFQTYFEGMVQVGSLSWTSIASSVASTTKEHPEQVFRCCVHHQRTSRTSL